MSLYKVPVTKAKGFVEVESDNLPEPVYKYTFALGLKALVNRMATVVKSKFDTLDEYQVAAMVKAGENVEAMMAGKIRIIGMKTDKIPGEVMTEARRQARLIVKSQIKAAGEKISDYAASDITQAANALITANPELIEAARKAVEDRHKPADDKIKVDVSAIKKSPKKVADAQAKSAARKAESDEGTLSAGKVQGHAGLLQRSKAQQPTARH